MKLQDKQKLEELIKSKRSSASNKEDIGTKIDTSADTLHLAKIACKVLEDKKVEDIVLLELDKGLGLADYFIIATASSAPQMSASLDSVYREFKNEGFTPYSDNQNSASSVWFLLDYGFLVIHLFTKEGREYYELDKLWSDSKKIKY